MAIKKMPFLGVPILKNTHKNFDFGVVLPKKVMRGNIVESIEFSPVPREVYLQITLICMRTILQSFPTRKIVLTWIYQS